jgi:hypothetical protein
MLTAGITDQILTRAATNSEFRQALKGSPRDVLMSEYNLNIPDSVDITVVEDTDKSMTLALPPVVTPSAPQVSAGDTQGGGFKAEQVKILWTAICSSDGPCS